MNKADRETLEVADIGDHYQIKLDGMPIWNQRKYPLEAHHSPMDVTESVILKLCEALTQANPEGSVVVPESLLWRLQLELKKFNSHDMRTEVIELLPKLQANKGESDE